MLLEPENYKFVSKSFEQCDSYICCSSSMHFVHSGCSACSLYHVFIVVSHKNESNELKNGLFCSKVFNLVVEVLVLLMHTEIISIYLIPALHIILSITIQF